MNVCHAICAFVSVSMSASVPGHIGCIVQLPLMQAYIPWQLIEQDTVQPFVKPSSQCQVKQQQTRWGTAPMVTPSTSLCCLSRCSSCIVFFQRPTRLRPDFFPQQQLAHLPRNFQPHNRLPTGMMNAQARCPLCTLNPHHSTATFLTLCPSRFSFLCIRVTLRPSA